MRCVIALVLILFGANSFADESVQSIRSLDVVSKIQLYKKLKEIEKLAYEVSEESKGKIGVQVNFQGDEDRKYLEDFFEIYEQVQVETTMSKVLKREPTEIISNGRSDPLGLKARVIVNEQEEKKLQEKVSIKGHLYDNDGNKIEKTNVNLTVFEGPSYQQLEEFSIYNGDFEFVVNKGSHITVWFERDGHTHWSEDFIAQSNLERDIVIGNFGKHPDGERDSSRPPRTLRKYEFEVGDMVLIGPNGGFGPLKVIGRDYIWDKEIYLIRRGGKSEGLDNEWTEIYTDKDIITKAK